MKGDFTRFSHKPDRHYTRVLKQQGRVDLDADWNEQVEIRAALDRTRDADVIGAAGVPVHDDAGFGIAWDGADLQIAPGRIYVDGLLCVLEDPAAYAEQSFGPAPVNPADGRTDLVYLDVWERHVTALEDPDLREVALGGPDTTTRVQTVCQVKVVEDVGGVDCDDAIAGWPPAPGDATLTTAANEPPDSADPCVLPPTGGFRGLENRLYRVEIHDDSDSPGGPTFKWSRDNGAVVFAVEAFAVTGDPQQVQVARLGRDQVLALHVDDWVEVTDDATELAGRPGTMAQITDLDEARRILTLSKPVTGLALDGHPRLRRWDQPGDAVPVTPGVPIALEDGVEITFGGTTFRTGDYWAFAARTVTAGVEVLTDAPPQGIRHHYARLALVTWSATGGEPAFDALIEDCRKTFPPLTGICAEDVCFDNTACGLVEADNVQEALDRLCEANDLRHHNKHLHGFGIVCGLQVACGPDAAGDERRHVTVREGYAIDCEGNNLILDEDVTLDLIEAVGDGDLIDAAGDDVAANPFLDDRGDGEVCLTLRLDEDRDVVIGVEPFTPPANTLASWLEGSLLMDFYNECIKVWVDLIRDAFTPPPPEEGVLVSSAQKNFTTFLNLAWQLVNPQYGRYVFLSPREDTILRTCYLLLRSMLQSKTFCAMFENARPFPEYPFPDHGLSTIFGKGLLGTSFGASLHTRVRLHPNGQLAYTVGPDEMIQIYDLEKEEMVAEVAVPGGTGLRVRDVAFSPEGDQVFAIATLRETDTLFAVADRDGLTHTWRPVNVLCGLELVTLAVIPAVENTVYATGVGQGLYAITPDHVDVNPAPVHAFHAAGHLVTAGTTAFASALTPTDGETEEGVYDRVVSFDVVSGTARTFPLAFGDNVPLTGRDDIAVVSEGDRHWLFAVTDPPPGASTRHLLRWEAFNEQSAAALVDLEEDTDIRLGHVPGSAYLLVAYEDCYRLRLVLMDRPSLVPDFALPVQISPLSLAASADAEHVYVLNALSNTLTVIPAGYFDPDVETGPAPTPGSQAFLDALAGYATGVFAAYVDLLVGLLQYLKDCFCDRFLVDCPACDDEDVIYLGVVSIRGGQVYKVCNFSKRKYVKSFPLMGYWLSVVPIVPLVRQAMERVCCAVLPDLFGTFEAPREDAYQAPVKGREVRGGVAFARTTNVSALFGDLIGRLNLAGGVSSDAIRSMAQPAKKRPAAFVKQDEVAGKPVSEAARRLAETQVTVAGVRPYDPRRAGDNLRRVARAPARIRPGARVTLYEQDGVVRYVDLAEAPPPAEAVKELRRELDRQKEALSELETIKARLAETQTRLTRRDEELAAIRGEFAARSAAPSPAEDVAAKVAAMEAELADLRAFRDTVTAFMKQSEG